MKANESAVDAHLYRMHRPLYPEATFSRLVAELADQPAPRIVDIGCGTGHSTRSLLASIPRARITGIEPDAAMLQAARYGLPEVEFREGSGEHSGLADAFTDAVSIGSALHWMQPDATHCEIVRILRANGLFLAYEYQFPKALELTELNDWIRRGFNERWRAPIQVPRGSFREITSTFRHSPRFELLEERPVPMRSLLSAEALTGLLLSQSRVVHYERGIPQTERDPFRRDLLAQIRGMMGDLPAQFDFRLSTALFKLS